MAALHLLDDADEDFVPLGCSCLFLLNSGFVKKVKIFQSLMQLHHTINCYHAG